MRNSRQRKGVCVVFTNESGQHMVMTPNGDVIPCLIFTRVMDHHNEYPEVLMKALCNLATDEAQAREIIASYKEC